MSHHLDDLIARHLDGQLDVAEQRQLADLLAGSAEARATLARYLRLEGAAIKLAAARQLGQDAFKSAQDIPSEPGTAALTPYSASAPRNPATRWVRLAWGALAAGLLVAIVLGQRWLRTQGDNQVAHAATSGEIGQLAEMWVHVQDLPQIDETHSAPSIATTNDASSMESDEPEFSADLHVPPAWMVSAMVDLAGEQPNPGEG